MPCFLKYMQREKAKLKKVIKQKGKLPTAAETRAGLLEMLKSGEISPARYHELLHMVDACVLNEAKMPAHTHEGVW